MNNQNSSSGFIIGVIVVILIGIVGFLAYQQGYFQAEEENTNGLEINLGGGNE